MTSHDRSQCELLDQLAEEFVQRYRCGERPPLKEYLDKYPDLAEDIRTLFPALVEMEQVKKDQDNGTAAVEMPPLQQIGDYRIVREVGRGAMGVVYEAEQLSLGRRVAVKVLAAHFAPDRQSLERFRREARSAAKLHHTNIVPVFEVGQDGGACYYAMQFIQGQSLDQIIEELRRLRRRSLPDGAHPSSGTCEARTMDASLPGLDQLAQSLLTGRFQIESAVALIADRTEIGAQGADATPLADTSSSAVLPGLTDLSSVRTDRPHYFQSVARIGYQIANALAYAHARNIIHRDIKPSNLLLDTSGVVWIADFGLAKTQEAGLTNSGDIVGTLRYMAPERLQGEGDERADVYALGLTLYELLVLRPAFEARDRLHLVDRIKSEEPAHPCALDRRIPRDLDTIVLKAIHKEPERRYQTAEAMAEDLRRFLANEPIKAKRTWQLERLRLWSRRNPALAALLVMLALVAVGGTGTAFYLRATLDESEKAHRQEKEAKREARLHEANALVGQAHGTRLSRRPGQRFEALDALRQAAAIGRELGQPPGWFAHLRNEAIAALALPDIHVTREFGSFPSGTLHAELNDDFTLYARTTETGGCTIRRVADDTEVCRLPELGEHAQARFGPGGMLALLGSSSRRFQLWDVSGTQAALRFEEQKVTSRQFRPNGDLLGLSHVDGSISIYQTSTCTRLHRLAPAEIVRGLDLCLHPTAPFVAAFSYYHRVVQVRDLRSGTIVASVLPPWPGSNGVCAWSPDGRTLLVPQGDGGKIQEYAFDPAAPALRPTRTLQGPIERSGNCLTFHPAGDCFVARGWQGVIDLYDAVSGQPLFSTQSLLSASDARVNFDRTGEWLAGARAGPGYERIGLWSFAGGQEYRYLVHAGDTKFVNHFNGPTVHPGGQLAAIGLPDGVTFFDLDTGRELAHIPSGNVCAQFDGAGNLLTNGFEGFFRWPVRPDPANPRRLLVGPPQRLPFQKGDRQIAVSRDGRVIAQSMWSGYRMGANAGGWVLHPSAPAPLWVNSGESASACSVSPDGRWAAFGVGGGYGNRVEVYEAATGKRVWRSPAQSFNHCRFSPDGRWLLTNVDNGQVNATGTWEPGPQLGIGAPFDATAELVVMGQGNGIHRLVELATGRELAQLEPPDTSAWQGALTPDGTKLVVAARNGLRVWDLRRVRTGLVKLGLDWDAPSFPPASASPATPLSIHLDLGDFPQRAQAESLVDQAAQHVQAKEHAKALAALRQAVKLAPGHAMAHNDLAWLLLTGPKDLRDPKQALPLARKAVELEPTQALYVNTLGVALYYTEHFADAIPVLERSLREHAGQSDAFDLLFLAMCHHRLGDAAKAKDCLERGKQWFQKRKGQLPAGWLKVLTAFQAEADAVLAQPPDQRKK
jgi:serine/threonine protein kinase/WD40 repeat protein